MRGGCDPPNDEIVVIDPGETLGRGLAYATDDPRHLLNVRVANMSAFADEPDHLYAWLSARRGAGARSPFSFISRGLYGDYLADLAAQALSRAWSSACARAVAISRSGTTECG